METNLQYKSWEGCLVGATHWPVGFCFNWYNTPPPHENSLGYLCLALHVLFINRPFVDNYNSGFFGTTPMEYHVDDNGCRKLVVGYRGLNCVEENKDSMVLDQDEPRCMGTDVGAYRFWSANHELHFLCKNFSLVSKYKLYYIHIVHG